MTALTLISLPELIALAVFAVALTWERIYPRLK